MMKQIRILVVSDNHVGRGDLLAEHGLSFWIEFGNERLLFDTGQGNVLLNNAYRMGIDLKECRGIVLSHGHYDHANGLVDAVMGNHPLQVWCHPDALAPKYRCRAGSPGRPIGISALAGQVFEKKNVFPEWTKSCREVAPGLFVTGEIPRVTEFEEEDLSFFLDEEGLQPDTLRDDQAVFFEAKKGIVVLLGCAHAGVINTIDYIERLRPNVPIHAILGGMHLLEATPHRLEKTVQALKERPLQLLAPAHCTGLEPTFRLWNSYGKRCEPVMVGKEFIFHL